MTHATVTLEPCGPLSQLQALMSNIRLKDFSSEELRAAGVFRDRCSEPIVCQRHLYTPPCELCEIEGDAKLVCTVCGAGLAAGTPAGIMRACRAEKTLSASEKPSAKRR